MVVKARRGLREDVGVRSVALSSLVTTAYNPVAAADASNLARTIAKLMRTMSR